MSDNALVCPKCDGEMAQGFTLDVSHAIPQVSNWIEGAPAKSFWTGIKIPSRVPIATFRCESCGYLESYARPEFKAT